jgi:hypothetical protein
LKQELPFVRPELFQLEDLLVNHIPDHLGVFFILGLLVAISINLKFLTGTDVS